MDILRCVKHKINVIYANKLTYSMLLFQVVFLIMYMQINNIKAFLEYMFILKTDIFLWLICIPVFIVIHRISVFTTYYSFLSRMCRKLEMIAIDYAVIALSTFFLNGFVILVPLLFMKIVHNAELTEEVVANIIFLFIRYNVLALFVQYLTYSLFFKYPSIQRYSNFICMMPIILFFAFTFPLEILTANDVYIGALDFTVGKHYVFRIGDMISWSSCIFYNIHLIGYLALYIWFSIEYLAKKMEFLEDEVNNS